MIRCDDGLTREGGPAINDSVPPFAVRDLTLLARGFLLIEDERQEQCALVRDEFLVGSSWRFLDVCRDHGWIERHTDDEITNVTTWEISERGDQALKGITNTYEVPKENLKAVVAVAATWVEGNGPPVMFVLPLDADVITGLTQRLSISQYLFLKDQEILEMHVDYPVGAFAPIPDHIQGEPFNRPPDHNLQYLVVIDAPTWLSDDEQPPEVHRLPFAPRMLLAPGEVRWYGKLDNNPGVVTKTLTLHQMQEFQRRYYLLQAEIENAARANPI